jgi:hypothetical protein
MNTTQRQVLTATPYRPGQMGSFGKAEYMLIRQFKFPDTYDEADTLVNADSDRLSSWDYKHTNAAFDRRNALPQNQGKVMYLEAWAQRAPTAEIIEFLADLLKAEENHPGVKWTGFRTLGTVNRSNGYPVWTYELFGKGKGTKTKVYSGGNPWQTPNVHRLGWRASQAQKDADRERSRSMVIGGGMAFYEDFDGSFREF